MLSERPEAQADDEGTEAPSKYKYIPLPDPSYIRLIKLYPFLPEDGLREQRADILSPVRIELISSPLSEAPSFTALSYTWGTSPKKLKLSVGDGNFILISENAHDILQRLRPEADDEPNHFWMDQLCINQNDIDEKWQQIRIMRHIYNSAIGTFVVLAGDSNMFDPVIAQIGVLNLPPLRNRPSAYSMIGEGPIGLVRAWNNEELPKELQFLFTHNPFRIYLKTVLENPVFSRAWIYQEIVSSKQVYLLGSVLRIEWDVFAKSFELFLRWEAERETDSIVKSSCIASLDMIIGDRLIHHGGGHKDWMLLHTEAQGLLKASDPRDNTIAITTFENFYARIPPYRALTVASLFLTATQAMINTHKSLDVFAALSGNPHLPLREVEKMPSWVPDWSRERDSTPLYWPRSQSMFQAAKGYHHSPKDRRQHKGREILVVKGKRIDTITVISEHRFEDFRRDESLVESLQLQEHCIQWLAHAQSQGYPLLQGERTFENCKPFARAMIAAMTASFPSKYSFTSDNFLGSVPDIVYDELVFMLAWYDEHMAGEVLYYKGLPHALSFVPRTYGSWKAGLSKLRQWTGICSGRRIAFGNKQRFGLVPRTSKEGDEIFILHGSKVPIVLRKVKTHYYRVIGQCYWHACMLGDEVDWKEDEGDEFNLI